MRRAIAVGAFLAVAINGPAAGLWQNLLLFAAVLAVGTFCSRAAGWAAATSSCSPHAHLWFDLSSGWKMLVAVAIAGGLETLIVMVLRRLPWPDTLRKRACLLRRDEGIPYGVAIAPALR